MALADNIVAYWKLDESSGTSVTESVNSITTTATNTEDGDWGAAKINNGITVDGSNEYVEVASNAVFNFSGSFSINFWMKGTDSDGSIVAKDNDSGTLPRNWGIELEAGKFSASVWNSGTQKQIKDTGSAINNNAWHMLTLIFTSVGAGTSELRGYVDTTEISASLTNLAVSVDYLAGTLINFGRRMYGGGGNYWAGTIDEVGIWARALTGSDLTALYNSGSGLQYPFTVNATVTPSAQALTLTLNAPTLTIDGTMTQSALPLTMTLKQPTITITATQYTKGTRGVRTSYDATEAADSTKYVGHITNLVAEEGSKVPARYKVGLG